VTVTTSPDAAARFQCSTAELERRWAAVRSEMDERNIDALVMQNSQDWVGGYVRWFTDVPGSTGYPRTVIFPRDGLMTVIHQGDFGGVRKIAAGDSVNRGVEKILTTSSFPSIIYSRFYDAELVVDELKKRDCRTVGLLSTPGMQYDFCAHLKDQTDAELVDATDFVDRIKAIKSPEDMAQIRACADMHDAIFADLARTVRPGMRDWEVSARARYVGYNIGSEQGLTIGRSAPLGKASTFAPLTMQGRELRKGDHLSFLVELNGPGGQYTELARTFVFGKPSNELADAFESVKAAQEETVKRLTPGTPCAEVFAAHNAFMKSQGLPEEARLYAHGQGYDMVERPLIRHDETMNVEKNMNFAVHPGYVTDSVFGVVCDNFFVCDDGSVERIHDYPQTLIEIDA
jgi:Xaa-Pro aminopeptidase